MFTKSIKVRRGKLSSWPAPPLEWVGHAGGVYSVCYSPDGQHVISGSSDNTIRIWDAETGAAVGEPLKGHTGTVFSVAYSPNGQHLISGSDDNTIRIWDAETGAAVGEPLKGHTTGMTLSVVHSPDGQHISASDGNSIHLWESFPRLSIPPPYSNPTHIDFCARPDQDGWVRNLNKHLLYWVPSDCRAGLHSPALLTLPLTSHIRSVSLDFDNFVFGTSWTQILKLS